MYYDEADDNVTSTAYLASSENFQSSKQSSKWKLVGLFPLNRGRRDERALASNFGFELCFELWKMSLQVGQAVHKK